MNPCRIARASAVLIWMTFALAISAPAQITVTSPTNDSAVSMPVWLRAHASSCNGSTNMTGFGYSVGNSPLITWGVTNYDIDTTDYRLSSQPSPGSQYVIHYKAWSDAGECPSVDVVVNVSGPATTTAQNVDDIQNAAGWNPSPCPATNNTGGLKGWFWQWDAGTAPCTKGNSNTYTVGSSSPNLDGSSRIFYLDWQAATPGGTPGERYSEVFGQDMQATHFVYDTYIYVADPQNIQNVELDTNQVWDANGDVLIYGLQCAHAAQTWEYTKNVNGKTSWIVPSQPLACDPQQWKPNSWHHVQLVMHRDSNGNAFYDAITFDGKTTNLSSWSGNSSFSLGWTPGNLLLNFQIDGINNSEKQATATAYLDGMTFIWW